MGSVSVDKGAETTFGVTEIPNIRNILIVFTRKVIDFSNILILFNRSRTAFLNILFFQKEFYRI